MSALQEVTSMPFILFLLQRMPVVWWDFDKPGLKASCSGQVQVLQCMLLGTSYSSLLCWCPGINTQNFFWISNTFNNLVRTNVIGGKELSSCASQMPIANTGWACILIENIFLPEGFTSLWSELHKGQSWATPAFEGRGKVCIYEVSEMQKRWGINNMRFVETKCDWMFWLHAIFTAHSTLSQIQAMIWSYWQAF